MTREDIFHSLKLIKEQQDLLQKAYESGKAALQTMEEAYLDMLNSADAINEVMK